MGALPKLLVVYSEPPSLIAFDLDGVIYTLKYEQSAISNEFTLIEQDKGAVPTNNVAEWIALASHGHYSLRLLQQLAEAWADGRKSAFSIQDVVKCSSVIFEYVRNKFFVDGLAAQYAEKFDIECMPMAEMKRQFKEHVQNTKLRSFLRIKRFSRVCERNGWYELSGVWDRLLETVQPEAERSPQFPMVDEQLRRNIELFVAERFQRNVVTI